MNFRFWKRSRPDADTRKVFAEVEQILYEERERRFWEIFYEKVDKDRIVRIAVLAHKAGDACVLHSTVVMRYFHGMAVPSNSGHWKYSVLESELQRLGESSGSYAQEARDALEQLRQLMSVVQRPLP